MPKKDAGLWSKQAVATAILSGASLAAASFAAHAQSGSAIAINHGVVSVHAGETWIIERTTRLGSLTIADTAHLAAAAGKSLTFTFNGVGTAVRAGRYRGKIVLTVSSEVLVANPAAPEPHHFRSAIYIENGHYAQDKSVAAAVVGGQVDDHSARDFSVTSHEENFNGIIVTGNSTFSIVNPHLEMIGNGGDDFAGFGAAIMSRGNAQVTVDRAHIVTHGVVRMAVLAAGNSTMTVNDSFIEVFNGILPAGYQFSVEPGKMMEVPYGLGISGNVRATNVDETATVHYNRSHIRAQAWGALASDGDGPTNMYATDTEIETIDSGYGAYANGDAHDFFSHCTFRVADAGLIVGGNGSATFTDHSIVDSRRFGVMMHQGTGGGTLTFEKGSVLKSRSTAIEIKARGTNIVIDDAQIHPGNGVLIQTMENDDPIMKDMPPPPPPSGTGNARPPRPIFSGDVIATFRDAYLKGDVVHAMKGIGNLNLTLEHSSVAGAITTATAVPSSGQAPTRETYRTIGEVTNTFGPSTDRYGLMLSLDRSSRWVVTQTSYLTALTIAPGAVIGAPAGKTVTLSVDGVDTPIGPGSYSGKLVMRVAAPSAQAVCDRACLKTLANQLVDSIVAHDAASVPLSPEYAATENSVPAALDMMVAWRTATASKERFYIVDPTTQQVFILATLSEGPNDTLLYGRLKASGRVLSEIEIFENRSRGQGGFQYSGSGPATLPVEWTKAVSAAALPTRTELLRVGQSIFDEQIVGIESSTDCVLIENGKIVAENPSVAAAVGGPAPSASAPLHGKAYVANADGSVPIPCGIPPQRPTDSKARVNLVDTEQGIVVSLGVVHGITEPYLVTVPTESAFVPVQMLEGYARMLQSQRKSGLYSAPALRSMAATGMTAQIERVYGGKIQGMMLLVNLGAAGGQSVWTK